VTGNRFIDTILVAITTLMALGLLGLFVYTEVIYTKPPIDQLQELERLKAEAAEQVILPIYNLEKIVINLPSQTTRLRFLNIEPSFVSFKQESHTLYDKNKVFIQNTIIQTASNMDPDELNSVMGKIKLEHRLKEQINAGLGGAHIKEILFPSFVIQ
jgi:flagellar protein FliL